nr:MAG TPA: hypothetical protein [Caudoviricetes sp.]
MPAIHLFYWLFNAGANQTEYKICLIQERKTT